MEKILLLLAFAVFLSCGALLLASGDGQKEEEYDAETFGPADPIIWVNPVKSVVFDHKVHTRDAGLDCDSCHDDLFEMEAGLAEKNKDFTMKTMYSGGYCGSCHDGSTAFAANTRCTTCHIGVRGQARLSAGDEPIKKGH